MNLIVHIVACFVFLPVYAIVRMAAGICRAVELQMDKLDRKFLSKYASKE